MSQTDYLNELKKSAEAFPKLHNENNARRREWINVIPRIADALQQIVNQLSENDFFKSNIYLINEDEGNYNYLSSVSVKSGITAVDENISENGFIVHFQPTINGRLNCNAYGFNIHEHTSVQHFEIDIVDLEKVDTIEINRLFLDAFQRVKETSFYFKK
ncbi:hypothetical protein OA88_14505 [Flavobacterium sp. JRM]|nr:hypothetical protein OA88_14505 [Flavobacterium sp. JRM]